MTIFIDDVEFKTEPMFWEYISKSFGKGAEGIKDKEGLRAAMLERPDEVEFYFYDYEDIIPEMEDFAQDIAEFLDALKAEKKDLKIYYRSGADGL
ncbi:MAG: hypothetical protein IJ806_03525 [Ruminococcus sp.]|nr:hypothetical protein [Ruminococcus sp.]